jgi:hypothetical protein
VSVGHIARIFELAGIPTVSFGIQAFRNRMVPMSIPRLVLTPELLSKTLGKPNDASTQRRYLEIGLNLLVDASEGNTWVEERR